MENEVTIKKVISRIIALIMFSISLLLLQRIGICIKSGTTYLGIICFLYLTKSFGEDIVTILLYKICKKNMDMKNLIKKYDLLSTIRFLINSFLQAIIMWFLIPGFYITNIYVYILFSLTIFFTFNRIISTENELEILEAITYCFAKKGEEDDISELRVD